MTRSIVEDMLRDLAAARGWDYPGLDGDGCVMLRGEGDLDVLVTYVPSESPAVVLYAELAEPFDPLEAFRAALRAMPLWGAGDNITLGVVPDGNVLTASFLMPVDEAFQAEFADAFDHFCARAAAWRQRIAFGSAVEGENNTAEGEPAAGAPGGGALRV